MRKKIPAASAVAVVVQPRAEDEVCRSCEEEAGNESVSIRDSMLSMKLDTYMMKNQPKKPQWLPLSTAGASAQAYSVRHSSRRV